MTIHDNALKVFEILKKYNVNIVYNQKEIIGDIAHLLNGVQNTGIQIGTNQTYRKIKKQCEIELNDR